jgi:hypothetical protein
LKEDRRRDVLADLNRSAGLALVGVSGNSLEFFLAVVVNTLLVVTHPLGVR